MSENLFHNPNDLAQSLKNLEEYESSLNKNTVMPLHGIEFNMKPSDDKQVIDLPVDIKVGPDLYKALDDMETYQDYKDAYEKYLNLGDMQA